jgi:hypothetical protein
MTTTGVALPLRTPGPMLTRATMRSCNWRLVNLALDE